MGHDPRLVKNEDQIEELRKTVPDWIKRLERPSTPAIAPGFGPLEGVAPSAPAFSSPSRSSAPSSPNSAPKSSMSSGPAATSFAGLRPFSPAAPGSTAATRPRS